MSSAAAAAPPAETSPEVEAAGSNFYYSFLFLPPEKRDALIDVYAFCHEVDDLVDRPRDGVDPRTELDGWRRDLEALYGGGPAPAPRRVARLAPHVERYGLPQAAFLDILDGVTMDLEHTRYATWEELRQYCLRVASAVGLLCIEIFGYRVARSREYARELGLALQLTNILRDVASDARRGRLYLPGEDLARFGVPEEDLLEGRLTPAVRDLMAFECGRAREHFFSAESVQPPEDRMALFAGEIMGRIYFRILEGIERRGFDVWSSRVRVSRPRKAAIAFSVWLKYKLFGNPS